MVPNLQQAVRHLAAAAGFDHVAFARAEPTAHAGFLDTWLAQGWHGSMDWFARQPQWRKDVRTRYAWARSFVCISIDYPAELPANAAGTILPRMARYARQADYHEVFKPALAGLERDIIALGGPGTKALWYQDTGPFLERGIAASAGLGWVGKNTMLIDPKRGSFTHLALVLTSLDLAPDTPITDHCGTCTRCLEACPTNAFPAPYQMNASRCISYLTIEHEGPIAHELREGIGGLIFGCDICNDVCPWNSKAAKIAAMPPKGIADLTLRKILLSKPEHLSKRIEGSALARTGEAGLKRNAAIAAGNERDESLVDALEQAARHESATVREAVYHALQRIGSKAARAALARSQSHEVDDGLREMIIAALRPEGGEPTNPPAGN